MIFIFGLISIIIQKNTLCTNKIRMIYFCPKKLFFLFIHLFSFFGGGGGRYDWRCFMKKAVLKSCPIFTWILQTCDFINKRLQHRFLPLNITKFLRKPIFKNICKRLLLIFWNSYITLVGSCFCIDLDNLLIGYEKLSC